MMSTSVLKVIPIDPKWTPGPAEREKARALLLRYVPESPEVIAVVREHVEFIDQGGNFERILCPGCGEELVTEWWQSAMDKAYEGHFEDLRVRTPCCRSATTLNELKYEWAAGFARFSIEARDPNRSEELSKEEMGGLEALLGCRLRQVWAHY
jgi:hypothetical protein